MKSERRHELQTNTLADNLGNTIEKHGDRIKLIGAVAIAVMALVFAVLFITGQQTSRQAKHWNKYFGAINASDVALELQVASDYFVEDKIDDTAPGHWTAQSLADLQMSRGAMQRFSDKETAEIELAAAKLNLEKLAGSSNVSQFLKVRATFGLGQVHESLCEPDLAKKRYEEVMKQAPESALAKAAETAIERVDRLTAQGWFVWFKDKEVTPAEVVDPKIPASLEDLPGRPNLDFELSDPTSLDPASLNPASLDPPKDEPSKDAPSKDAPPKDEPSKDDPFKDDPPADAKKEDAPKAGTPNKGDVEADPAKGKESAEKKADDQKAGDDP